MFKEKCSKIVVIRIRMQRKDKRTSDWKRYWYKHVKMYGFIYKKPKVLVSLIFLFFEIIIVISTPPPYSPTPKFKTFSLIVTYIHTYT